MAEMIANGCFTQFPHDKPVPVYDVVMEYSTSDTFHDGELERTRSSLSNTRSQLARLVDLLADKGLFTNDELVSIARGY
jgi:hypothetical protein